MLIDFDWSCLVRPARIRYLILSQFIPVYAAGSVYPIDLVWSVRLTPQALAAAVPDDDEDEPAEGAACAPGFPAVLDDGDDEDAPEDDDGDDRDDGDAPEDDDEDDGDDEDDE